MHASDTNLLRHLLIAVGQRKEDFTKRLATLNEEAKFRKLTEQEIAETREIDRQLAVYTEERTQNYKAKWDTLTQHEKRPCPLCFIEKHGHLASLRPLPSEGTEGVVKCVECGEPEFDS